MSDPIRLDLGCGTKKKEGHLGVDRIGFPGVDVVMDVGKDRWPWNDDSVDEVYTSHMVEHLTPAERIHFANELHRVLKKGARAQIVVPNWSSSRAYGDLTHQWPPVTGAWLPHLNAAWRKEHAPHEEYYACDFDYTMSWSLGPEFQTRNLEFQQFAIAHYTEAGMDMLATVIKR